ncbi:MAG: DUF4340 domain-containing protein [Anaerolineales bacterium]|nr:DUF4340 domain-containing protein [Anaerolineales bacterium]
MSWRTTAVLFVILLALGGFIYYQSQQEPSDEPPATAEPAGTLPAPTPEQISLVRTTLEEVRGLGVTRSADDAQTQFLRDETGIWTQTVPTTTLVISQTMETQVIGLINLRTTNTLAADANPPAAYGLDTPAYQISLAAMRDATTTIRITLLIGNKTPTGNSYYVQLDGDPRVHVAPAAAIDNMINLIENPPLPEPEQ